MRRRGPIVLVVASVLASADLIVKALVHTDPWDFHERSRGWVVLSLALLVGVTALTVLPSRATAFFAGTLDGGGLGNLLSAEQHHLAVPNPFVAGRIAFNLADVFVVVGAAGLTVSLAVLAIRYRRLLLPPRRWERALLRRLRS